MPHPKGRIEVAYSVANSGVNAKIRVPEGVPAKFIWKQKDYALHGGEQTLQLP